MDPFDKLAKALDDTTQLAFSVRTGIPQATLSQLRQKKRPPSLAHIPALNQELGTTYEDWARVAATFKKARRKARAA